MRRLLVPVLLALATLAACAEALPIGPTEAVGETSDDLFTLVVRSPSTRHVPGAPIEVSAELLYHGPKNGERVFHAASPIGWQIVQLDGDARMEGGMDMPCLSTDLTSGAVRRFEFEKGGAVDETGPFTLAWYRQPGLTLPAGRWRVVATMSVSLEDCGGKHHGLEATVDLTVTP